VKVGGPDDLARLEAVRENTSARIRIDGNEGWTLETARELMPRLIELEVEFVEQPFPVGDLGSYTALRELPERIPVILDESCKDLADVAPAAAYADGINIKLAKSGGIREALRMIHAARALGLKVMLGCMIESELGIAQAAQVASLVDYVDLDGHLLISSKPFSGLGFRDGGVVASAEPGLGVTPA
jgi:L-alanine-DL-glutamate epimerase-like enolase superfamily enzyme